MLEIRIFWAHFYRFSDLARRLLVKRLLWLYEDWIVCIHGGVVVLSDTAPDTMLSVFVARHDFPRDG